jgi:hypothetical protein
MSRSTMPPKRMPASKPRPTMSTSALSIDTSMSIRGCARRKPASTGCSTNR